MKIGSFLIGPHFLLPQVLNLILFLKFPIKICFVCVCVFIT